MIFETIHRAELPSSLPISLSIEERVEILLKNELSNIKLLNGDVYPLSVPKDVKPPYLAYAQVGGDYDKDLQGYTESNSCTYEINILSSKYSQLKLLERNVVAILKKFIGIKLNDLCIKDVTVSCPVEKYEEVVKLHRANIEFTIYL